MIKSLLNDNKIKKILIAVLGLIVIASVVTGIVIWNVNKPGEPAEDMQQGEGLAASLSPEENENRIVLPITPPDEELEPTVEPSETVDVPDGNFQVTMTTEWNYPDINTPAEDSYVENAKNNTLDAKLKVVLTSDESVVLYESPLLPVGSYTAGIPLKVTLSPGSYDCVAIYTLYRPGDSENAGSVRVGLTINIGSENN